MVLIKLIFVVITIIFFSTNAFAEKCTSKFNLSFQFTPDVGFVTPDVGFENQYYKSLDKNFKKHGVCIVEKSKGHFPKQKRIRSERIRCYLGLKYISLSDGEVPF